ncbi:uncharacterized protein LOC110845084 isoform X2 [Folsomia candida]|uniref:uncharacterized protein LOC110845084 isoform X2 n=1 Tax=Folsomia candida TaxID=158441 RepID=UPI001604B1FB|nr:uncharacterized protein LOC110845084 isoform X2 [Folsomia candida]
MWVLQRVSLQCFLVLFCGLYFSIISCQEENDNVGSGNGGVKRKSKRVQESKFKNNMYDQIAQESDHDSGNGNINSNNNNIHLSSVPYTAYGMRIQNNIPNNNNDNNNKARNPRAEPNYMRNYHYSSRDSPPPPPGNWGGDGRQMSSFSLGGLQAAASSAPADYAFGDAEDNSVAAGGHGHQSYGHGHGWGGGHSSGGHGHSHGKDCNSALGLLGVLGLASYLQNVLRQMSTTAAPGRKRRDTSEGFIDIDEQTGPTDDVTPTLLPLLMSLSHARDGKVPFKCAYRPYCIANSFLTKRLGDMGSTVCDQLTAVMESSVENVGLKPKWRRNNAMRELRLAGKTGAKGRDCYKRYPHCSQLDRISQPNSTSSTSPPYFLPFGNLGEFLG